MHAGFSMLIFKVDRMLTEWPCCAATQNLGEAEYVVALYQYMRLRGYPAERISILTTYNGQKALIQDVIERRCVGHPAFGRPLKASLPYCRRLLTWLVSD